jgi:hypothetical protein
VLQLLSLSDQGKGNVYQMPGDIKADGDGNAPKQDPVPIPPPPVERNEKPIECNCKPCSHNEQKDAKEPPHWTTYAQAVCAVALVIITGAYTWYARNQTTASITSASAAQQAANIAQQTLISSTRPWVGLEGDIAVLSTDAAPKASKTATRFIDITSIRYRLKNFGNSPALEVVTQMEPLMERWDYSREQTAQLDGMYDELCQKADSLAYDLTRKQYFPIGNSLFPGVVAKQRDDGMGLVIGTNRQTPVEILGCIKYKDGFGDLHHTHFCVEGKDWNTPLRACGIGQSAD